MSSVHQKNHCLTLILISILIMLSACSSAPKKNLEQFISNAVNQGVKAGDGRIDKTSAEFYIRAAIENEGKSSQQYFLKAAEILYANNVLSYPVDTPLAQGETRPKNYHISQTQLLASKIAITSNLPIQALALLPAEENLSTFQLFETNSIRAQAFLKTGRYLDAIRTQIKLEQLTEADDEKEIINHSIWNTLSSLPSITIENISDGEQTFKGWIDLALVMRNAQSDITWLQEDILDWGTQYPLHPVSNNFIDQLLNDYIVDYSRFNNIAMFLPSSGRYELAAEVITNGFLSAYYKRNKDVPKPNIRFYDTGKENFDFDSLYEKAIKNGANVIIGPIEKKIISKLTEKKSFEVPVLTLNYAEDSEVVPANLYQFGLLPEDEAVHIAEFAYQQNKRNAAVLVPESDWGERIANAFKTHYELLGGEVVSQKQYTEGVDDFSKPIKSLLNIDHSNTRYKRIQRLLKTDIEFTPHRRQDIDMIFIAATHRAARGIVPALRFHHASDIQTYATSHVYTGHIDKAADRDLDGLMFCDIPWTITSKNNLKNTFKENWSNQQDYTRLYALGVDAYALIHNLNYLKKHNDAYFVGETGNIIIDEKNRLHRKLVSAQFIKGRPVYIDPEQAAIDKQNEADKL